MSHRPSRLSTLTRIATAGAALLVATCFATPGQASPPQGALLHTAPSNLRAPAKPTAPGASTCVGLSIGGMPSDSSLCLGGVAESANFAANGVRFNRVIMQTDGNLVSYDEWGNPLWVLPAWGAGCWAAMQTDGNLVIYNCSGVAVNASNTANHPGAWLKVQDDHNSIIYLDDTGIFLWINGHLS